MKPKLTFALTALVLTLAIGVTAAFAGTTRSSADPGVTSTSILLGTTSPLSGVASNATVGCAGIQRRTTPAAGSTSQPSSM